MLAVLCHTGGASDADAATAGKAAEARVEQGGQDLAHAVGAEIEAKHAVAVPHAPILADHRRNDELVADLVCISIRNDGGSAGKARPLGVRDRVIGLGHALPPSVAIHGVVPTAHRDDRDGSRECRDEARNVLPCRAWRRIAAIGKGMHDRRHRGLGENVGERSRLVLMRMDPTRRHQSDEMARAPAAPQRLDQFVECRRPFDIAASDRRVDAGQVLHHETAGTDVEMSDLGIAHLPLRQADIFA